MGSTSEHPELCSARSNHLPSNAVVETTSDYGLDHRLSFEKSPRSEQTNGNNQKPLRDVKGVLWVLVVLSILSSTFLFSLDNTIVADVQPSIVRQFDSTGKLPWLSVAFLLGATSSTLFWYAIVWAPISAATNLND